MTQTRNTVVGVLLVTLLSLCSPTTSEAFPLLVSEGDTLAALAQKLYGRVENEKLLVSANGLDARGGIAIVPGLHLEVPAVRYQRVVPGDTWPELAQKLLGGRHRAAVLAFANDSKPWLRPSGNTEIMVPYNLRFVGVGGETLPGLASRFLGSQKRAWMLRAYNQMEGIVLKRGEVVLIPLTELTLTEAGREAARLAGAGHLAEAGGAARRHQEQVRAQLPLLLAQLRNGRYIEAIATGVEFLSGGPLTAAQQGLIHRQLLEAYVAVGSTQRAFSACRAWRSAEPLTRLDRIELSPKILAACLDGSYAVAE